MINTEYKSNGVTIGGIGSPDQDKKLPGSIIMTALRDVQNQNVGSIPKEQKGLLPGGGRPGVDAIKVCGTKRPTPAHPLSSQCLPSFSYGTNENVMNTRRRIELELGRGRLHNSVENYSDSSQSKKIGQSWQDIPQMANQARDSNVHLIPIVTSNNITPIMAFASSAPSFPSSFGKHNISSEAPKVPPELTRTVHIKSTNDQLRTERHSRLHKYLKQCDEANQREFIQMLLHLSPADLSKHAQDLETRAIKLSLEEGKEMMRMKSLNIILAKPPPPSNLPQTNKS